jgi:hypothetical protein
VDFLKILADEDYYAPAAASMRLARRFTHWLAPMGQMNFAIVLLLAFVTSAAHAANMISGAPRIVDGDKLVIGTTKIRLASIDAPAHLQA